MWVVNGYEEVPTVCVGLDFKDIKMTLFKITAILVSLFTAVQAQSDNLYAVTYSIREERIASTEIGDLVIDSGLINKYDQSALNQITFQLMNHSSKYDPYFEIDHHVLRTKTTLDREKLCPNVDICKIVMDLAILPSQFFNILKVTLNIEDINDNAPKFPSASFQIEILETAFIGSQFILPIAKDPDSGIFGVQIYRLMGQSSPVFELSVTKNPGSSSDVHLVLKQNIDRELIPSYQFQLVAVDGGSPQLSGSVDISVRVLDVNDNPPVFDNPSYEVVVREDTQVGARFLQVHATDLDEGDNGRVSYSLAPTTEAHIAALFSINSRTGALSTLAPLDHEAGDVYFLSVVARDSGAPSSLSTYSRVKVAVEDMNDHAPAVSVQALTSRDGRVQVLENAPAGTFVAQVLVTDSDSGDNGRFTCSLDSPYFELREVEETQFRVLTTVKFDREVRDMYHMNLVCRDLGAQPQVGSSYVAVEIVDVNDHSPEFVDGEVTFTVVENNEPGSYIGQLNASDKDSGKNAKLVYEITPSGFLHVHADTGLVTALKVFDHEQEKDYQFTVIAKDQGQPVRTASMTLQLKVQDTNDCAPQFSQSAYSFGTFENQPENTEIGTLSAYDKDSSPYNIITYSLDQSFRDAAIFQIDGRTGKLITKKKLDRETKQEYNLKVLASNDGYYLTGSTNVTIHVADRNDNPPNITFPTDKNQTIQISTMTAVGSSVAKIEAFDRDVGSNAMLTFSIHSGNDAGFFDINPILGQVLIDKDLSGEASHMETLVVLVQDQGNPPLSSVTQLNLFLNDSMAVIAALEGNRSGVNTTAILVICLLVFVITIIVAVLFALIIIRRRRNRKEGQKYNCRLAADQKLGAADEASDRASYDGRLQNQQAQKAVSWKNGEPIVIENPQAHSSPSEKRNEIRRKDPCCLREIQLQVHDLLQPNNNRHHDPDSDSLTDSGKGPSEEGDQNRPQSDCTDDNIQPPLPPRQPKTLSASFGYSSPRYPQVDPKLNSSWHQAPAVHPREHANCSRNPSFNAQIKEHIPPYEERRVNSPSYYVNQSSLPSQNVSGGRWNEAPPLHMQRPSHHRVPDHGRSLDRNRDANCPSGPAHYNPHYTSYAKRPVANLKEVDSSDDSEQSCEDDDGGSSTSGSFIVESEHHGRHTGYGRDIIV